MRANLGANPKESKEGRRMNDTQTLILIHSVAWPILIWALSKTWSSSRNAVRFSWARTMKRPLIHFEIQPLFHPALRRLSAMRLPIRSTVPLLTDQLVKAL